MSAHLGSLIMGILVACFLMVIRVDRQNLTAKFAPREVLYCLAYLAANVAVLSALRSVLGFPDSAWGCFVLGMIGSATISGFTMFVLIINYAE